MKQIAYVVRRMALPFVVMCLLTVCTATALAVQTVALFVNSTPLQSDQPAFLEDQSGVTYVPLRAVAEGLHGTVAWEDQTQTITLTQNENVVTLRNGSDRAILNGVEKTLDGPVYIVQSSSRTVVPLRFFADVLPFRIQVSATAGVGIFDDQPESQ